MQNKLRIATVVVAALVLAIGTYLAYEKYSRRSHVMTMVRDAAARLHTVLQAQAGDGAKIDLEAHATAIEGYAGTLRRMNTASFTPLADAADDYLITAREIARRSVEIQRTGAAVRSESEALGAHIRNDRGAAAWTGEAVRLKQALDKDFREYRLAVEAYRTLLGSYGASQATVATYVEGLPLIEDAFVKDAGAKALATYTAAEQNMKQVTDLGAYAGRR
jgi:hypothetical protein